MIRNLFILILIGILAPSCNRKVPEIPTAQPDEESMMAVNRFLVEKDIELIESYIDRRNWNMERTDFGYWMGIIDQGNGREIKKGDALTVAFRESLLDGTVCYSSETSGPRRLVTGQGKNILGLEEGLTQLHEGDSAVFIFPPNLAYGLPGDGDRVPRRAIIVYEVRILDILD